jgi:hypothetical protein
VGDGMSIGRTWDAFTATVYKWDRRITPVQKRLVSPPPRTLGRNTDDPRAVVYYIGTEAREIVKIGTTINLVQRVRLLESSSGQRLRIWAFEPGSYTLEAYRHCQFSDDQLGNEWFELSRDLADHIAKVARNYGIVDHTLQYTAGGGCHPLV